MIPCLAVISLRLYDYRLLDAVLREDAGSCSRSNVIHIMLCPLAYYGQWTGHPPGDTVALL